ncbi:MAG: hypothetical protein SOZ59_10970 [Candidatus Limivivens sp.]|nr:hypothetical protein [Candidatus Limivivens sp.]
MIYKHVRNTTFLLDYAGQRFLINPALQEFATVEAAAERELSLGELLDVDAVIVTRLSEKNFDAAARHLLPRGMKVFVPEEGAAREVEGIGFSNVEVLEEHTQFQFVELYKVPAFSGLPGEHTGRNAGCGVLFFHPVLNSVYVTGESAWNDGMKKIIKTWKPRLIVLNFGFTGRREEGRCSMSNEEIAAVHLSLPRAKIIANLPEDAKKYGPGKEELQRYIWEHRMEKTVLFPEEGEEVLL